MLAQQHRGVDPVPAEPSAGEGGLGWVGPAVRVDPSAVARAQGPVAFVPVVVAALASGDDVLKTSLDLTDDEAEST